MAFFKLTAKIEIAPASREEFALFIRAETARWCE